MCCLVFHYEFKHVETIDLLPAWCPKSHRSVFRAVTHTHSTKVQSRGQQSWRPPSQEVYDRPHRAKGRRTYPRFTFGRFQEQSVLVRRYSSWFMLSVAQNILHSDTAGRWTEGDVDSAFSPRSLRRAISTNIHQQIHGLKQLLSSQTKQLPTKNNPTPNSDPAPQWRLVFPWCIKVHELKPCQAVCPQQHEPRIRWIILVDWDVSVLAANTSDIQDKQRTWVGKNKSNFFFPPLRAIIQPELIPKEETGKTSSVLLKLQRPESATFQRKKKNVDTSRQHKGLYLVMAF